MGFEADVCLDEKGWKFYCGFDSFPEISQAGGQAPALGTVIRLGIRNDCNVTLGLKLHKYNTPSWMSNFSFPFSTRTL